MTADLDAQLGVLAEALLRRRDNLVDDQLKALSAFPHYDDVPAAELRSACDRNVARTVAILRGQEHLPPEVVEDERRTGARRAQQGIPAEVVLAGYRAVIGVIRAAYLEEAAAHGIDLEATLLGTRKLWELADHFSGALVASRHEVDLDLARRHEQHRMAFIRSALDGTAVESDSAVEKENYGVDAAESYFIVRARSRGDSNQPLLRELERTGWTATFSPLVAPFGRDIAGILEKRPRDIPAPANLTAVVGPVRPLGFAAAFAEATQLLDAAWRFNYTGIVDKDLLGLRVGVAELPNLGEHLLTKYVIPILNGSSIAEDILDSVRAYLESSRSIRVAADSITIHVNTLRYRLEKFEAFTGCQLSDTETLAEVWWALQYRSLSR